MHKQCACGQTMAIRLRTVIYKNKFEIDNVPIFTCEMCQRMELVPGIKDELTGLINRLGKPDSRLRVRFDEVHEFAHLVRIALDRKPKPVDDLVEDRINELLDLLLLAQSLGDSAWMDDIRSRLAQLSWYAKRTYDMI